MARVPGRPRTLAATWVMNLRNTSFSGIHRRQRDAVYVGGGAGGTQGTMSGQYDGSAIRATGWEAPNGVRECTLALTRG